MSSASRARTAKSSRSTGISRSAGSVVRRGDLLGRHEGRRANHRSGARHTGLVERLDPEVDDARPVVGEQHVLRFEILPPPSGRITTYGPMVAGSTTVSADAADTSSERAS
jgi:hypothetical protein